MIANEKPDKIQLFRFGMIPFWTKNKMALFNAHSEVDFNKEDAPEFDGAKGIITKPAFRKPIRSQRCIVIVDYFWCSLIGTKVSTTTKVPKKNIRLTLCAYFKFIHLYVNIFHQFSFQFISVYWFGNIIIKWIIAIFFVILFH